MYLRGLGAVYYLKNGSPASSYNVGDVMGFNVPGYTQVWLDQTQNGSPQYSGPFTVPMSPYVLQSRDVGTFNASVYELKNGAKGKLIGTDSVTVLSPSLVQQTFAPPTVQQVLAPEYSSGSGFAPGASGSGTLMPSGVATPSAPPPPPVFISTPSGPIDLSQPMTTEGEEAPETQAAGFTNLGTALLIGAGMFILFSGGKRR